jgi:hypothetical protein
MQTCPLCRAPLAPVPGWPETKSTSGGPDAGRSLSLDGSAITPAEILSTEQGEDRSMMSAKEILLVGILAFSIGVFMWWGSYQQWNHGITYSYNSSVCEESVSLGDCDDCRDGCTKCQEGFINAGATCFTHLGDVPSVKMGNVLGNSVILFRLIAITQICGVSFNIFLIQRSWQRSMLPRKGLIVAIVVLFVAVVRVFVMDSLMLPNYFVDKTYQIFHQPDPCESDIGWLGSNGVRYCNQSVRPMYYIATNQTAYTDDQKKCSIFEADSPLLDYKRTSDNFEFQFWEGKGHARFSRIGWVIGGEFAFYLLFAVLSSVVATTFFVVSTIPGEASLGWQVLAFSFEIIQIGSLCPAAIFTHGSCLQYTDPLGIPLEWIRYVAVRFGYFIAVAAFVSTILAVVGSVLNGALESFSILDRNAPEVVNYISARPCLLALVTLVKGLLCFCYGAWIGIVTYGVVAAFKLLLAGGLFLGCVAVVGQLSKSGPTEMLTTIALISDLLFKMFAAVFLKAT